MLVSGEKAFKWKLLLSWASHRPQYLTEPEVNTEEKVIDTTEPPVPVELLEEASAGSGC